MDNFEDQFTHPKRHIMLYGIIALVVIGVGYLTVLIYQSSQESSDDLLSSISTEYVNDISLDSAGVTSNNPGVSVETTDDPYVGSIDAKVHIVEFGDFECSYCNQEVEVIKQLQTLYGNQIFFQFRDFPVVDSHDNAYNAAIASECAHEQSAEKYWQYHDRLFQFQESLTDELYVSLAQRIGLNEEEFTTCFNAQSTADDVQKDYLDGLDVGVTGTPTFFINGYRVPGAISFDMFKKVIDQLLEE